MRKVAIHSDGLPAAAQAVAARHLARRPLGRDSAEEQNPADDQRVFMGNTATLNIKRDPRRSISNPVSVLARLYLRLHRRLQRVHVRLWRNQIVFTVPMRFPQVFCLHTGRRLHHSSECGDRKCGRHVGSV